MELLLIENENSSHAFTLKILLNNENWTLRKKEFLDELLHWFSSDNVLLAPREVFFNINGMERIPMPGKVVI